MKLQFLYVVIFIGICCAAESGGEKKSDKCIWMKIQQCVGELFISAPMLFWDGKESVELKTRDEFNDCVVEMLNCTTTLLGDSTKTSLRSQKQKDFCGKNEDCYDNEEDEEEEHGRSKYADSARCFLKNKNLFFKDLADTVLDIFGNVRYIMLPESKKGVKKMSPNMIMCHIVTKTFDSLKRIMEEKCGGGSDLFLLFLGKGVKTSSPYIYELCKIGSLLKQLVM